MPLTFEYDFAANGVDASTSAYPEWESGHHKVQITDAGVHEKTDSYGVVSNSIWIEFTSEESSTLTCRDYYVYAHRNQSSPDKELKDKAENATRNAMGRYAKLCDVVGFQTPCNDLQDLFGKKLVIKVQVEENQYTDRNGIQKTGTRANVRARHPYAEFEKLSAQDSYTKSTLGKKSVAQPASAPSVSQAFASAGIATTGPATIPQGAPAGNAAETISASAKNFTDSAAVIIEDDVPF